MPSKRITVEAECADCNGSGVYRGFAEPKGIGVVCMGCDGEGKIKFSYAPFTGRKKRKDIKTVRLSAGNFLAKNIGPEGGSVTYKEFLAGKMPAQK